MLERVSSVVRLFLTESCGGAEKKICFLGCPGSRILFLWETLKVHMHHLVLLLQCSLWNVFIWGIVCLFYFLFCFWCCSEIDGQSLSWHAATMGQ